MPTPRQRDPSGHTAFFKEHIAGVVGQHRLVAIGIGASGPVDVGSSIRNPKTLGALSDIHLPHLLGHLFGVPCLIDNDAVTAAFGEAKYGAAPFHRLDGHTRHWSRRLLSARLAAAPGRRRAAS
ncbi:ROK family protein [Deinococcus sp. Arct2-2]|uniref:ROK family protein n=1 Tax=Deinococcus sp. Arct2-2 TaxID=2568653 RepID=UPI0010A51E15|nr:ROK family protein [Deinococcus sp. Arct2-2]THF70218.1 ROK family protein [Deinococcus sp. Arct2-2]